MALIDEQNPLNVIVSAIKGPLKEVNMSKRSKACEISKKVKEIVWNRDNKKCICCGVYVPMSCANAHFIKRSQRRIRHRTEYSNIMP